MVRLIIVFLATFCFGNEFFSALPEPKYDKQKALLGRDLYFDATLGNGKSCDSCHNLYYDQSGSSRQVINGINPPSVLNAGTKKFFYKNGDVFDIVEQAKRSLTAKNELNADEKKLVSLVSNNPSYANRFASYFKDGVTFENIAIALAEFEKTIVTKDSKFDRFLKKTYVFDRYEARGYELFLELGCVNCHNGVNIGDNTFYISIIGGEIVKVPSLRNTLKTKPFFYSGSKDKIRDILNLKAIAYGKDLLSERHLDYLEAFINTLNGKVEFIEK